MSSPGSRTSTGGSGAGTGPTGRRRRSGNRCVGRSSPLAEATGGPRPARGLRCPKPGRAPPSVRFGPGGLPPLVRGTGWEWLPARPAPGGPCMRGPRRGLQPRDPRRKRPRRLLQAVGAPGNSYRASRPARRVPVSDSRSTSMRFASFWAMVVLSWWPTNAFAPGP